MCETNRTNPDPNPRPIRPNQYQVLDSVIPLATYTTAPHPFSRINGNVCKLYWSAGLRSRSGRKRKDRAAPIFISRRFLHFRREGCHIIRLHWSGGRDRSSGDAGTRHTDDKGFGACGGGMRSVCVSVIGTCTEP